VRRRRENRTEVDGWIVMIIEREPYQPYICCYLGRYPSAVGKCIIITLNETLPTA
jgi:hypothetical protein